MNKTIVIELKGTTAELFEALSKSIEDTLYLSGCKVDTTVGDDGSLIEVNDEIVEE